MRQTLFHAGADDEGLWLGKTERSWSYSLRRCVVRKISLLSLEQCKCWQLVISFFGVGNNKSWNNRLQLSLQEIYILLVDVLWPDIKQKTTCCELIWYCRLYVQLHFVNVKISMCYILMKILKRSLINK